MWKGEYAISALPPVLMRRARAWDGHLTLLSSYVIIVSITKPEFVFLLLKQDRTKLYPLQLFVHEIMITCSLLTAS